METSTWLQAILIGIGGTLTMDTWAYLQQKMFGIPSLDYSLVARWLVLIPRGKLVHRPIMATPEVVGEKILGWIFHYLIGTVFALILVFVSGDAWLTDPSFMAAFLTGNVTLLFPFYIIQPCLGFGVAASKASKPWRARCLSLLAHNTYGIGLFGSALLLKNVV